MTCLLGIKLVKIGAATFKFCHTKFKKWGITL